MDVELALRCLVIGGQAVNDNYDVLFRGYLVGHIVRESGPGPSTPLWYWGNARMPNEDDDHGRATTFEDAKAAFLAAWLKPGDPLTRLYWLRERLGRPPTPLAMTPQTQTMLLAWNDSVIATA